VNAVQTNPAQAAIAAKDRWIANLNDAAANGRYEAGLSKVTLAGWKQAATDKGASNMAAGARNGAAKVQANEQVMGPVRDAIVASLPPRGTIDQNIERAAQMARQMAATRNRRA
jgi:type IV secretory pathway TrbL component